MISQQFEKMIIEGKARNNIFNVSTAVSNLVIGRARHAIINKVHVHPLISTYTTFIPDTTGTISQIDAAIKSMYNNSAVFTITFTSNNDTYNITFKNKIIINTSAYQNLSGRGTLICATSQLDFSEDVFFKFTGEAITIETSEIRDLLDSAAITTGPANFTKNSNPSGFNDPVIITQAGANFVVNPLGPQTNPAPGQFNFNDFVIPKVGTGIGGNKMLDTLGPDANITIPLININYLEIF